MNPNRPDVAIIPSYASTNLDHLGLVAGMVDELGLVGKIDALIPQDLGQRQVSLGQGFQGEATWPRWASNRATETCGRLGSWTRFGAVFLGPRWLLR